MLAISPEFDKARILVIGDVMLDRYWSGHAARISPEAPVPVVRIKNTEERVGGAGNVALNIAKLGGQVTLLGVVGADAEGELYVDVDQERDSQRGRRRRWLRAAGQRRQPLQRSFRQPASYRHQLCPKR